MVVVYYLLPFYLDAALETIQSIKDQVELNVIIELSPDSKFVFGIDDLSNFKTIEKVESVLGEEKWRHFSPYFAGIENVLFVVHKHKRSFAPYSFSVARQLGKFIRNIGAEIIHFDSISVRATGLYFFIRSKKIFITIHDPLPHSGESSWKIKIPNLLYFNVASGYFFYSWFARRQFEKLNHRSLAVKKVIRLQPYTFIRQFLEKKSYKTESILFFGRLSVYKGIDLLLEAIPMVLSNYPDEKFVIAGSSSYGYQINSSIVDRHKDNIEIICRHLSNTELAEYIGAAKFIVCPYRDATQSGVLMTSFAAKKMVVATSVGSFTEYIEDNVNGLLAAPESGAIANKIIEALKNEKYKQIEKMILPSYSLETGYSNRVTIMDAYRSA